MGRLPGDAPDQASYFIGLGGASIKICLQWPKVFQGPIDYLLFDNFRIDPVAVPDLTYSVLTVNELGTRVSRQEYARSVPSIFTRIYWKCPLFHYREVLEYLKANERYLSSTYFVVRASFLIVFNLFHKEIIFFAKENGLKYLGYRQLSPELFSPFFASRGEFLLHSSGVVRDDKAALFLAPDGGGKTTVAKSVPTAAVLCDDQAIIKNEPPRFFAYPTPWGKINGRQVGAPVQGLFFIEKAGSFRITPISPVECITRIWDDNSWKLAFLTAETRLQVFDLVCKTATQIKAYRCETLPGGVDWAVIDECLADGTH